MGYAVYEDPNHPTFRWAGYGVPADCDWPDCHERIDRGLAYKCETEFDFDDDDNEVDEEGCGLYFCETHRYVDHPDELQPKPDLPEWEVWMLTDPSWAKWREENPTATAAKQARWDALQKDDPERAAQVKRFIDDENGVDTETSDD